MGARGLSSRNALLPIDVLLWHLGLVLSPGTLLPIADARGTLKLARWPDFGRIGAGPVHMKLSAKLTSRAYEIDDLFQAVAEPRERTVAFLNACAVCGLFADAVVDRRASAPVPRATPGGRPLGALGFVFLVDNSRPDPRQDLRDDLDAFADLLQEGVAVIGIGRTETHPVPDLDAYYEVLASRDCHMPAFTVDVRRREDVLSCRPGASTPSALEA